MGTRAGGQIQTMSKNGKQTQHDGPIDVLDPETHAPQQEDTRLRRAAHKVGHGAAEVRRVAGATSAGARDAFEAADAGPELRQGVKKGTARAATLAAANPVPTAIGFAYLAGFLKGHRIARRRLKK